jgi:hypothetical protein
LIKLGVAEVVHQDFVHWDLGHLTGLFPRSPLLMLILNPHITSYYNHSTHHNHHSTQITGTLGLTADLWQLLRLLLGATLQQPDTRSARDQRQAKRCRKSSTEVRKRTAQDQSPSHSFMDSRTLALASGGRTPFSRRETLGPRQAKDSPLRSKNMPPATTTISGKWLKKLRGTGTKAQRFRWRLPKHLLGPIRGGLFLLLLTPGAPYAFLSCQHLNS